MSGYIHAAINALFVGVFVLYFLLGVDRFRRHEMTRGDIAMYVVFSAWFLYVTFSWVL